MAKPDRWIIVRRKSHDVVWTSKGWSVDEPPVVFLTNVHYILPSGGTWKKLHDREDRAFQWSEGALIT